MNHVIPWRTEQVCARVVSIGDPHLEQDTFITHLPIWDAMVDEISRAQPHLILLTGDLFGGQDTNHVLTVLERKELAPRIRRLSDIAHTFIVKGNHDHPKEFSWLPTLAGRYPITTATKPGFHFLPKVGKHGLAVIAFPYPNKGDLLDGKGYRTIEAERDAMIAKVRDQASIFAGSLGGLRSKIDGAPVLTATHMTWLGAKPGGGEVWQHGGDVTIQPIELEAIGSDLVIGGHIHKPEAMWLRGFLSGSFSVGSHGEGGDDRYWWLHDLYTPQGWRDAGPTPGNLDDELLSWAAPAGAQLGLKSYRYRTGVPMKRTVKMSWDGDTLRIQTPLEDLADAEVRVCITCHERDERTVPWDLIKSSMARAAPLDWKHELEVDRPPRAVRAPTLAKARTDLQRLLAWMGTKGIQVNEATKLQLRDRLEDPSRDIVEDLVAVHPEHEVLIRFAAGRD